MQLNQDEKAKLTLIKRKAKKEIRKNKHYIDLESRKTEILNYLNNKKTKETKKLLEKYEKLGKQVNKIEMETAFKITIRENRNKNILRNIITKFIKRGEESQSYNEKFEKITEDINYKRKMKSHNKVFKELIKKFRKDKELLYELESIESEMATIETEQIRECINKE